MRVSLLAESSPQLLCGTKYGWNLALNASRVLAPLIQALASLDEFIMDETTAQATADQLTESVTRVHSFYSLPNPGGDLPTVPNNNGLMLCPDVAFTSTGIHLVRTGDSLGLEFQDNALLHGHHLRRVPNFNIFAGHHAGQWVLLACGQKMLLLLHALTTRPEY